ncbi:MAG: hypothetical protein C5B56_01355 [Proteobacteria bacterium]|nr:MAG: hypothetical protein C5B56_01355 [Pseudomonadota bacterium]
MNVDERDALDGNAAAGLLRELFACEATTAAVTCAGCGAVAQVGAIRVFGAPMGAIFRCARCDTAVIRLTRLPTGLRLDMRGASSLFVAELADRPPSRPI